VIFLPWLASSQDIRLIKFETYQIRQQALCSSRKDEQAAYAFRLKANAALNRILTVHFVMHHKRKRPKNARGGCLMCKTWKVNGFCHRALRRRGLLRSPAPPCGGRREPPATHGETPPCRPLGRGAWTLSLVQIRARQGRRSSAVHQTRCSHHAGQGLSRPANTPNPASTLRTTFPRLLACFLRQRRAKLTAPPGRLS
jgi:hypothetical protein